MVPRMSSRKRSRGRPAHPDVLTPAEWSVLVRLRDGMSDRQIAEVRGTTTDAVRFHVRNLIEKLQVPDREALERWEGRPLDPAALDGIDLEAEDRRIRMAPSPVASRSRLKANATMLLVRDVARTAEWFRDVLGFEIGEYLREQHQWAADRDALGVPVFVFVLRDGQRVALSRATGAGEASGIRSNRDFKEIAFDLYFWVDGLDDLYSAVRENHAALIQELRERPYAMREFTVRTPDGHAITFGEQL